MQTTKSPQAGERTQKVGDKFDRSGFEVHYNVNGRGWYRLSGPRHETLQSAQKAMRENKRFVSNDSMDIGGMVVSFSGPNDTYIYRIIKVTAECEVMHID